MDRQGEGKAMEQRASRRVRQNPESGHEPKRFDGLPYRERVPGRTSNRNEEIQMRRKMDVELEWKSLRTAVVDKMQKGHKARKLSPDQVVLFLVVNLVMAATHLGTLEVAGSLRIQPTAQSWSLEAKTRLELE